MACVSVAAKKRLAWKPLLQQSSNCASPIACREDIFKEIDILVGMNHENVIFLKEYFEEGDKVGAHTETHCVQMPLRGERL